MASGDTKTESLLNILGNGGSIEGITGSGNTKTQDYLVDAIERLQRIEDEISGGGGGGGSVILYVKYSDLADGNEISLYKDADFNSVATIQEIWQAAYDGKDIKIIQKRTTEDSLSSRTTYNVYQVFYPAVCTIGSMDEVGMNLYLSNIRSSYSKNIITLQTFSAPEYNDFYCSVDSL